MATPTLNIDDFIALLTEQKKLGAKTIKVSSHASFFIPENHNEIRFSDKTPSFKKKRNSDVNYIVYDLATLKIEKVAKFYDKEITVYSANERMKIINITHPMHKTLLDNINKVNGTNHE